MEEKARTARERKQRLEEQLQETQRELTRIEASCHHQYRITYEPIYHKSHQLPGDPPGTMGIDWRGPVYVPSRTEDRWRRYCGICGKEDYTTHARTEVETKKIPMF